VSIVAGTREIAALLLVDILDYSRLAEADARCRGFEGCAAI
jgi:hypothetical protein